MPLCCCQDGNGTTADKVPDTIEAGEVLLRRCAPPVLACNDLIEVPVNINVYSLLKRNGGLKKIGMGVFHCGVVVYGIEWGYGESMDPNTVSGLFCAYPGQAAGVLYRTIHLGVTTRSPEQVDTILHRLENEWRSADYHILAHNCNHFAQRFCDMLSTEQKLRIPAWCNRAARVCNKVVPRRLASYIHRMIDETPPKAPPAPPSRISELPRSVIPALWYNHCRISQKPRYVTLQTEECDISLLSRKEEQTSQTTNRYDPLEIRVPGSGVNTPQISIMRRNSKGRGEWYTLDENQTVISAPKQWSGGSALAPQSDETLNGGAELYSPAESRCPAVLAESPSSEGVKDSVRDSCSGTISGANTGRRSRGAIEGGASGGGVQMDRRASQFPGAESGTDEEPVKVERNCGAKHLYAGSMTIPVDKQSILEGEGGRPNHESFSSAYSPMEVSMDDTRVRNDGGNATDHLMRSNDTVSHVIHVYQSGMLRPTDRSASRDVGSEVQLEDLARSGVVSKTIAPSVTVTSRASHPQEQALSEKSQDIISVREASCGSSHLALGSGRRRVEHHTTLSSWVVADDDTCEHEDEMVCCSGVAVMERERKEAHELYSDPGSVLADTRVDGSLFVPSKSMTEEASYCPNVPNPLVVLNRRTNLHKRSQSSPF